MRHQAMRGVAAGLMLATIAGCEAPGVAFESAFPSVLCEAGGQRRVRVYGHGFEEGVSIQATFGQGVAGVSRVDDFTLDVTLPDQPLSADRYPWDPHDVYTGALGLYAYVDDSLEAVAWDVLIPRSQLTSSGAPDFKDLDDNELIYHEVPVQNLVVGYDEVVDEYTGDVIGEEAVVIPGTFNLGYFTTGALWEDANGEPLGGCVGDGREAIGEFCYEPLYFTQGGRPLLYDGSDFAYDILYAPWDPYLFKGAYFTSVGPEDFLLYYDGRSNESDYAPGNLFNQSFGAFFTLDPAYVYTDGLGEYYTFERPPADPSGLTYVGFDVSGLANDYYPGVLPISHSVDLVFKVGSSNDEHVLESPLGLISRDFDYSWFYSYTPYYDFTEYKAVDLDEDGQTDEIIPADGSWGCVWLSQ